MRKVREWKLASAVMLGAALSIAATSSECQQTSDDVQRRQSETMLKEATSQTGMPAIKNFRERKLLKDILELRDQDGLVTFTYTWSDYAGKLSFFCHSIGYGIPYATQYTNPEKYEVNGATLPQADPNALFSPASAEGTWVMCADPAGKNGTKPVYIEPRIVVSPFKLIP